MVDHTVSPSPPAAGPALLGGLGWTLLSVIGLIGIPLGTLINAYILYLLHSEKGKR